MEVCSVTLSPMEYNQVNIPPINVGEKIKCGKKTEKLIKRSIRGKLMVYRMLKKKFKPIFIVAAVFHDLDSWRFHLKPYNF
jgi:hypothetical protein